MSKDLSDKEAADAMEKALTKRTRITESIEYEPIFVLGHLEVQDHIPSRVIRTETEEDIEE